MSLVPNSVEASVFIIVVNLISFGVWYTPGVHCWLLSVPFRAISAFFVLINVRFLLTKAGMP